MKKTEKKDKQVLLNKIMESGKKIAIASKDKYICKIIKDRANY